LLIVCCACFHLLLLPLSLHMMHTRNNSSNNAPNAAQAPWPPSAAGRPTRRRRCSAPAWTRGSPAWGCSPCPRPVFWYRVEEEGRLQWARGCAAAKNDVFSAAGLSTHSSSEINIIHHFSHTITEGWDGG
jgi:hypothetical protein